MAIGRQNHQHHTEAMAAVMAAAAAAVGEHHRNQAHRMAEEVLVMEVSLPD